jgi:hypothetical protein
MLVIRYKSLIDEVRTIAVRLHQAADCDYFYRDLKV